MSASSWSLSLRFALFLATIFAQAQTSQPEKLAPYYPTPPSVVQRMLEIAKLQPGEKHFDLGSGDGRVVIMAADKFKADATGVELDDKLYSESTEEIRKRKLDKRARIIQGDLFQQDYSSADVVTVYLLPSSNSKIQPLLEKQLKSGARIVAHDFEFAGWTPAKTEDIADDGEGRSHTIYLYVRP